MRRFGGTATAGFPPTRSRQQKKRTSSSPFSIWRNRNEKHSGRNKKSAMRAPPWEVRSGERNDSTLYVHAGYGGLLYVSRS